MSAVKRLAAEERGLVEEFYKFRRQAIKTMMRLDKDNYELATRVVELEKKLKIGLGHKKSLMRKKRLPQKTKEVWSKEEI